MRTRESNRYERIGAFVTERFGISLERYSPTTIRALVESLPDCALDAEAIGRIISVCSIGETMFMRHPEQLAALSALVESLPSSVRGHPLRIWSAGCATGEEAYSLAATLSSASRHGASVLGTDLNPAAIERARAGRYRLWSMRGTVPSQVDEWLEVGSLDVVVRDHLRPLVDFRVHNLVEPGYPTDLDIIVCRNVLLYFDDAAAKQVMYRFANSLEPGGILVTGFFDPEPPRDGCFVEERANAMRIYRRVRPSNHRDLELVCKPPPLIPKSDPPSPSPPTRRLVDLESVLSLARGLAAERSFAEALDVLEKLAERFPLQAEVHVLAAMIADEAGQIERALDAARKSVFIVPDLAIGHYLIASCLERLEKWERAAVHFSAACRALARVDEPTSLLLHGEGLTVAQLRRMIDVRYESA